jgi:predicted nucleic acid-binding Zn ribbon protein
VSRTINNGNNQKLTEQDIVDRAARRARRWFWLKIVILILVVVFILLADFLR